MSKNRPSDEEIHAAAFNRMAAQQAGNENPRRRDDPVFIVEKRMDLKEAIAVATEAMKNNPEGPANPRRVDAPLAEDCIRPAKKSNEPQP